MEQPVQFGRYLLHRRIAVGGMAEIFKATLHGVSGFEKPVVVKQILPQYAHSADFIEMLIDEAKIAVSLEHGNIVAIYELGKAEGIYFIAMEYVHGKTVAEMLEAARDRQMPIPVDMAVFIAAEICKGLDYMHRRTASDGAPLRVVHRDINPANVMVSMEGMVKIADFGIAKARTKAAVTERGVVKGTYGYMSPEQIAGHTVDHRADIFSTGVVVYEMLAGQRLFPGTDILEQLERVRQADIPPPSLACPRVPPDLDGIVLKALATDPEDRYQEASALQIELSRFLFSPGKGATSSALAGYMRELFPAVPEDSGLRSSSAWPSIDDEPSGDLEWPSDGRAGSGTQSFVIRADMIEGLPGTEGEKAVSLGSRRSDESVMNLFLLDGEQKAPARAIDPGAPASSPSVDDVDFSPSVDDLGLSPHEESGPALPSEPFPGLGQDPLLDTADLLPSHDRKRLALWVLISALAVGGFGLLLYLGISSRDTPDEMPPKTASQPKQAAPKKEAPEPTPPPQPAKPTGSIALTARPAETSIFLHIGDTPVALADLDAGRLADAARSYLVRLEHPGYRTVNGRIGPEEVASGKSVTVAMRPEGTERDNKAETLASPREGSGRQELTSDPPGASVWLAVGEGRATLIGVPHRRYYFMALHPGYETAFVTVLPAQFAQSRGSIRETIVLAREAGAGSTDQARAKKTPARAKRRRARRTRSARAAQARRRKKAAEARAARRTKRARKTRRPSPSPSGSSEGGIHLPQWAD